MKISDPNFFKSPMFDRVLDGWYAAFASGSSRIKDDIDSIKAIILKVGKKPRDLSWFRFGFFLAKGQI